MDWLVDESRDFLLRLTSIYICKFVYVYQTLLLFMAMPNIGQSYRLEPEDGHRAERVSEHQCATRLGPGSWNRQPLCYCVGQK
jgi:hypothetical protein